MTMLSMMSVGCAENLMDEEKRSNTLKIFKNISPEKCEKYMGVLKWFGTGTVIIVITIIIHYLNSEYVKDIDLRTLDLFNQGY